MAGYMIDTAAAIDGLTAEGIPVNQARAIVRTIAQRNEEVATKSDVQALKGDMQALKGEIRRLDARIDALRTEFKSEMKALESRLNMKIYLMAGVVVAALKGLEYLGI